MGRILKRKVIKMVFKIGDFAFDIECSCKKGQLLYLNIRRNHYAFCDNCKEKLYVGSNLLSSWRFETKKEWKKNFEKIKDYKIAKVIAK